MLEVPPRRLGELPEPGPWRRYLAATVRYKWLILAVTVVGAGAGFTATRFIKPLYKAQAIIWVESAISRADGNPEPIHQGRLLDSYAWVQLLKSYQVLDEVVRRQKLYLVPSKPSDLPVFSAFELADAFRPGNYRLEVAPDGQTFLLRTAEGRTVQSGAVGDSIGVAVGFKWLAPARLLTGSRVIEFRVNVPRDAALSLADGLDAQIDRNGNFLRLELTGPDPERVAGSVNAVLDRYLEVAADLKRNKLTELSSILTDQLATAADNLKRAEYALESFRVKTITVPTDEGTPLQPGLEATRAPVLKSYFDNKLTREQFRLDRDAIQRALAAAGDSGVAGEALEAIGSVQQSADLMQALRELTSKQVEVRALLVRYTPAHPPVAQLLGEVADLRTRIIPGVARSLVKELQARESELEQRINSASSELQQIPPRSIEEARLRREVVIAENLYTTLQERSAQARLAEASSVPDVRALDRAVVPEKPFKNTAPRLMLMGLLASLATGLGIAVLLDRTDSRFRYPEQVTAELGLPILAAIPRLSNGWRASRGASAQIIIEALRGTRLNVLHAFGSAGPMLLTVTSPGSGDGKSFLCSNLALAFADAGFRTLLIDGDTRRGALHRVLNARRVPGLTDALETLSLRAPPGVVQTTDNPLLDFIGSGTRMRNAPELLSSTGMTEFLAGLKGKYSVILVDSPPLGAGVDAFVLGTMTGNLLLVFRTGATDRELAGAKLDVLDRLPIRILGAVLNDVRESELFRSYAYYLPGYEAADEQGGPPSRKLPASVTG